MHQPEKNPAWPYTDILATQGWEGWKRTFYLGLKKKLKVLMHSLQLRPPAVTTWRVLSGPYYYRQFTTLPVANSYQPAFTHQQSKSKCISSKTKQALNSNFQVQKMLFSHSCFSDNSHACSNPDSSAAKVIKIETICANCSLTLPHTRSKSAVFKFLFIDKMAY